MQQAVSTTAQSPAGRFVWIRTLFVIAALYDAVLGVAFLAAGPAVFNRIAVTPPNHWGYVQFPALLLIVFALMFVAIAARPTANRNLIPFGILLKLSYCGVVFGHWIGAGLPAIWKPFAIIDLAFAALFIWAWIALRSAATR